MEEYECCIALMYQLYTMVHDNATSGFRRPDGLFYSILGIAMFKATNPPLTPTKRHPHIVQTSSSK